jgi:hypothetical protein
MSRKLCTAQCGDYFETAVSPPNPPAAPLRRQVKIPRALCPRSLRCGLNDRTSRRITSSLSESGAAVAGSAPGLTGSARDSLVVSDAGSGGLVARGLPNEAANWRRASMFSELSGAGPGADHCGINRQLLADRLGACSPSPIFVIAFRRTDVIRHAVWLYVRFSLS